jgi:hypothetical protein
MPTFTSRDYALAQEHLAVVARELATAIKIVDCVAGKVQWNSLTEHERDLAARILQKGASAPSVPA